MTTLAIFAGGLTSGQATVANTTSYGPIGAYPQINSTTESTTQVTMQDAGSFQNLYCRLTANGITSNSTINLRDNSANTTQTASLTASTTGEFEDPGNAAATITAGHGYDIQFVPGATTNTVTFVCTRVHFNTTTDTATRLATYTGTSYTAASTTYYIPLNGAAFSLQTSETITKCRQELAGTMKNLMANVQSNSRTTTTTIQSRWSAGVGGNGSLAISVLTLATGLKEDTIHSDTISAGDDYNLSLITGSDTSHSILIRTVALSFINTSGYVYCLCSSDTGRSPATTSIRFYSLAGDIISSSTELPAQIKAGENKKFVNLTTLITANNTGASTFTFRKNGVNGKMNQSITASSTGVFSDSVNVDYVVPTDEINYSYTAGASSGVTIGWMASWAVKGYLYSPTDAASISESLGRKAVPNIAAETKSITSTLTRIAKPNIPIETKSISSTLTRIAKPVMTTQTTPISEGLNRFAHFFRTLTETKSISSTLTRTPKPKIAVQTTTIGDSLSRFVHFFRTLTETKSISDSLTRKPIPNITAQTTSISDSLRRNSIVRKITQTTSIAELLSRKIKPTVSTQTVAITSSLLRKPIPKLAVQTVSILESLTRRKNVSMSDSVSVLAGTILRTAKPRIAAQTTAISGLLVSFRYTRTLTETTVMASTLIRKAVPKIAAETKSISDSLRPKTTRSITETASISAGLIRKFMPHGLTGSILIFDSLSTIKGRLISITDTVTISDSLNRFAHFFRTNTESASVSETLTRKPQPKITAQTTTISDSIGRLADRLMTDTVSISSTLARKVVRPIHETASSISDSIKRKVMLVIPDGTDVLEFLQRFIKVILPSEEINSSDNVTPRPIRTMIENIPISDSLGKFRRFFRTLIENVNIIQRLITTTTVAPTPPVTSTGAGFGWAGGGERTNRPVPVRNYLKDWTMPFRRRGTRTRK